MKKKKSIDVTSQSNFNLKFGKKKSKETDLVSVVDDGADNGTKSMKPILWIACASNRLDEAAILLDNSFWVR